jgi:hypothetical protein
VRVGWAELPGFSFRVVTLTPPLSREPGEGVLWSRTDKGLCGAEGAENAEFLKEWMKFVFSMGKRGAEGFFWSVSLVSSQFLL